MATSSTVASFLALVVVAMAALQAAGATPPAPPPPPSFFTPTYCAETLFQLYNCSRFLTIGPISSPPASCCTHLREVLSTPAAICLCHAIGREISDQFHINIDPIRLALLPIACWAIVPPQLPGMCVVGPVPPISPPAPVPPPPSMRLLP